jgi:SPW repeat
MATTLERSTHRHWEDWFSVGAGVLIMISPWVAGGTNSDTVVTNAFMIGLGVVAVAILELTELDRWEEWLEMLLGLWLIAAPWILGYSDISSLTAMHVALGVFVALLACLTLWQDRSGIPPVHRAG